MLASLDKLARLPAATRVCCAHEYTLSNLRFALAVEPDNPDLAAYFQHCETLRASGLPTLPSSLETERQINPFLRIRNAAVRAGVRTQEADADTEVALFAAVRAWKNRF